MVDTHRVRDEGVFNLHTTVGWLVVAFHWVRKWLTHAVHETEGVFNLHTMVGWLLRFIGLGFIGLHRVRVYYKN